MIFSALSFTAPLILLGLVALPAIYYLLRFIPPRPETISFPPTRLLMGLVPDQRTPSQSPWWLTLLRMLVAACVILALAGPLYNPRAGAEAQGAGPVLVVLDNGWASASRWAKRQQALDDIITRAEDTESPLYIAATAGPAPLLPLTPAEARSMISALEPRPFEADRAALAKQLSEASLPSGSWQVYWLNDGIEDAGAQALRESLVRLAGAGSNITLIGDAPDEAALALFSPASSGSADLAAVIRHTGGNARTGAILALTARGEQLARVLFALPAGQTETRVNIALPLELRNQVARLEIEGESSAGGVYLLDAGAQRKKVGLIAAETNEDAQPLLSPTLYIKRALAPFTEVVDADTGNIDEASKLLVDQAPSVIILSDVGRLIGAANDRLGDWVERGGTLVRFAGPRLEQGGDVLLPAPLREGGRTLGGALTWAAPQKPAPFEEASPFAGIKVPDDVAITRQVLVDPARMTKETEVWARLEDGTPLVAARKIGAGTVMLFHVTANADWSNLPMSGLFVEMLKAAVERAPAVIKPAAATADIASAPDAPRSAEAGAVAPPRVMRNPGYLQAKRVMDGFGRLRQPQGNEQALAAETVGQAKPSANTPPGYYGPQLDLRALNVMGEATQLQPLQPLPDSRVSDFAPPEIFNMAPWLFLAAFLLFVVDSIVSAIMFGGRGRLRAAGASAAILLLIAVAALMVQPASAAEPSDDEAMRFAITASLDTRLAYVVTGDAEADRVSRAGLSGLSRVLASRTAVEPGEPIGLDIARDELSFFPLIYWPVLPDAEALNDEVLAKIDAYMKQGGMIVFDTREDQSLSLGLRGTLGSSIETPLARLLGKLDIPPLQKVPEDHVLTKAFYLLQTFPGRWDSGDLWVEARSEAVKTTDRRPVKADGVSSIIVTSNDLAGAWALDSADRPMFACVPGGDDQREMSFRAGVNIVMYALTGNYKADQVHVPALLERLGH
jgi:hypothetical protein